MKKISAQFDPYKGLFGCTDATFKSGHYSGTMFRFPLRNKQSMLSSKFCVLHTSEISYNFETVFFIRNMCSLVCHTVQPIALELKYVAWANAGWQRRT